LRKDVEEPNGSLASAFELDVLSSLRRISG
jgi:hypothetical protein